MLKWLHLPPKPVYKKEVRTVGIPLLAVFLLLFLCRLFRNWIDLPLPPFMLTLLCEILVFLCPSLVYVIAKRKGYSREIRLRRFRGVHLPYLIAAFFALFSGCLLLSILCGGTDTLGNSVTVFEKAQAQDFWMKMYMALVLAILPAVAEELFFRGILPAEYERRGGMRAILMSTLFFSLIHFDFRNLPVYLFSGLLLALTLYATDSLPATMLLHAAYNLLSLFGQRYLNALYTFTGNPRLFLFLVILIFLVSLIFLCRAGARIYRRRDHLEIGDPRRRVPADVQLYTILDAFCDPFVILSLGLAVAGCIIF